MFPEVLWPVQSFRAYLTSFDVGGRRTTKHLCRFAFEMGNAEWVKWTKLANLIGKMIEVFVIYAMSIKLRCEAPMNYDRNARDGETNSVRLEISGE